MHKALPIIFSSGLILITSTALATPYNGPEIPLTKNATIRPGQILDIDTSPLYATFKYTVNCTISYRYCNNNQCNDNDQSPTYLAIWPESNPGGFYQAISYAVNGKPAGSAYGTNHAQFPLPNSKGSNTVSITPIEQSYKELHIANGDTTATLVADCTAIPNSSLD